MSSTPILRQQPVTLVPEELKNLRKARDGTLTLTARNLSFVEYHNKTAQIIPYAVLVVLIILFFVRTINGTLPFRRDSFIMLFSLVAAVTLLLYSAYRFYQITTVPAAAYQLDIPLVSIANLAEEELKFTHGRRVLRVNTYSGQSYRFTVIPDTADWVNAIGDGLSQSYGRSLQFRQDGDIATWQVKNAG